jgi:hypothetical protein
MIVKMSCWVHLSNIQKLLRAQPNSANLIEWLDILKNLLAFITASMQIAVYFRWVMKQLHLFTLLALLCARRPCKSSAMA